MSNRINIVQGEYAVTKKPDAVISTLLGSCISVCLYQPAKGIGGMNHFLLPGDRTANKLGMSERHGAYLMELLINGLIKQGVDKSELSAKIFGGAKLFDGLSDVGASNAAFAERFLRDEGIPIVSSSTGGVSARRVEFWPASGRVRQRLVAVDNAPQDVRRPVPPPMPAVASGDVDLF